MDICVRKLTIIDSDSGLLPGWRQATIWTNAGILLIIPVNSSFEFIYVNLGKRIFLNAIFSVQLFP